MKLFAIRDTHTNKLMPGATFQAKNKAKVERDKLNATDDNKRYVVTYGPDHHKRKGVNHE